MITRTTTITQSVSASSHIDSAAKKDEPARTIESTSDERIVNNVMRHEYRVLSDTEKTSMQKIKDKGLEFWQLVGELSVTPCREIDIAQIKIEEAVMWAVKSLTK